MRLAAAILLPLFHASSIWPAAFRSPVQISGSTPKTQLSRTPASVMAIDSARRLNVVYWAGGLATTPATPSSVIYRTYSPNGQWSDPLTIDDSIVSGVGRLGGRHPSLAIAPSQEVWVVWHDHRNCTAGGSWIDNIELYADRKPQGGAFSASDIRLTTTAAGHSGDNAFTPKILSAATGRLSLCWYDFFFDANVSDIFLKTSDASGVFNPGDSMAAMRLTDKAARGGAPEFTVPDMSIAPDGTRHLAWAGGQGAGVSLYYAEAPVGGAAGSPPTLVANGTDFFDPPRIAAAPNGDVWIAFGDDSGGGNEELRLLRRRSGQPGFDAPVTIASDPSRQYAPSMAIAPDGRMHLAWVDSRSGIHVYYAIYDPATSSLTTPLQITPSSANWARPAIALDPDGFVYLLFERDSTIGSGDVWFTTNAPIAAPNQAKSWARYR